MARIKVGDRLRFKKFDWVITEQRRSKCGVLYYKYRVYRKYFFNHRIPLAYTEQSYDIFPWRWNFLKDQLEKNPGYHYTMSKWSNQPR